VERVSGPDLVGRRAELAALEACLPGRGRLVIIDGDAGVGKTRLVQTFAERAARDAAVLTGGCLQFETDIPYAPFAEALPELFTGGAGLDRASEYRRVADALTAGPTVLVLEDLHWADASTRDLLRYLHRVLADAPVLLIVTCRTDEFAADHPVARLLAELARSPRSDRIHLRPLDRPEVTALARAVLGAEPPAELVDTLLTRAEGNPFFTEELLAAGEDVPRNVREIVTTRLARLSSEAQRLARLASVAGRTVSHDLLVGLAGEVSGPALRELVDHGQLVIVEADSYSFRHALIQEALYRDLLPGERRRTHAGVAEWLTAHPELALRSSAAGVAAELAHHWDAAGDAARALAASVQAASAAVDGLAPAEAHAHYERALRRWPEVAEPPTVVGFELDTLLERAAEAASLAGHNQRAVELTQQRLFRLAHPERRALAFEQLSYQARSAGNWALARSAAGETVRLLPADSPARLRVESWRMGLDMLASRHVAAVRHAERLLPTVSADPMAMNRTLAVLGTSRTMLGHVEQGIEHLHRHREFALSSGNPRFIGVSYVNLSESLIWADRQEEALTVARTGVAEASGYGFDIYLLPILGNAVRALAELHRWDEAVDSAQDPDDPAADPFNWIFVDLPRTDVLLKRGDRAAATDLLKRIGAVLDGQDDVQYGTELAHLRARLAADEQRWDDARAAVDEGLAAALGAQDMWLTARLVATGVQVEAESARHPGAGQRADELLAAGRDHRSRLEADWAVALPRTRRALALAAAERTRLDPTPDPAAWSFPTELDRYLGAYARLRQAEALLLARGSRTAAAEALAEASTTADALGAAPLAELARALAGRARLTIPEAPVPVAAPEHGLTAREAEIFTMLGRGLTNAEIAGELFISAKTASVHVSNILRKLGVRSRIQAAALAHRREQS
jgi:DNA-binding CsgD family transcriptional regulator